MKITAGQNRRLHALLTQYDLMDNKEYIIECYTDGRTAHSSELEYNEAAQLIKNIGSGQMASMSYKAGDNQRRKILSICYQLPVELGFTVYDEKKGRRVVNMIRLNEFLNGPKSIFKKDLYRHDPKELSKVIVQFENILNGYLKK